jgi:hypothetical protein
MAARMGVECKVPFVLTVGLTGEIAAAVKYVPCWIVALLVTTSGQAQHQTAIMDDPVDPLQLPYSLELRAITLPTDVPNLHSYVAGMHGEEWVMLAGRTNGLHGLTGRNAFDPAFENREAWVIHPASGQSWRKALDSNNGGLTTDIVDSLSAVNTQFLQVGDILYVVGGYGYRRSIADHTTYATLTAIYLPGLVAWIKAAPGTETSRATDHINQLTDPYFKVTGGGLERIGEDFQLIFGQDYEGAYRPFLNGVHTQQVRRFKIQQAFPTLSLLPGSKLATPPNTDFRRRDLNVLPILERNTTAPGHYIEKAMVLGGVFTLDGGVWTLPVIIGADGDVHQYDHDHPGTLRQAVQQYHCVKIMLYHRSTDEMHTVLFGGISLKYYDPVSAAYLTDEQVPFVNDVTSVVRYRDGSMHQYRLPFLFPDIRAPWDSAKSLFFGTNAEFFPALGVPRMASKIIDLALLSAPTMLGWIHGGIVADAANFGITAASGQIFEIWLRPEAPPVAQLGIETGAGLPVLRWQGDDWRGDLLESSTDFGIWSEAGLPVVGEQIYRHDAQISSPAKFYRIRSGWQSR